MKRLRNSLLIAFGAATLAGCDNDATSYLIEGHDYALTYIREQRWFWSKNTDLSLVVARFPDCQRRHALKASPNGDGRAELFETMPGRYLLRRGKDWYALETQGCTLQEVAAPQSDAPGRALGRFEQRDGRLRFAAATAGQDRPERSPR